MIGSALKIVLLVVCIWPLTLLALFDEPSPQSVHIAMTGNITEMVVSWHTKWYDQPYVKYGLSSGDYTFQAQGITRTYLNSTGYVHDVILTGLEPDTTYFYVCGAVANWGPEYSFTTAPAEFRPFSIAVYGDMGAIVAGNTIADVVELAQQKKIDWIYHVGDISYADDIASVIPELYEETWNLWFYRIQPAAAIVPYMVCVGNHEYSCENQECLYYSNNFTAFNYRFRMPGNESGSGTNMFFSFNYLNTHFISISSESDYPDAPFSPVFGDQLAWLEADLEKASQNRDQYPWIIIMGHRPLYSASTSYSNGDVPIGTSASIQKAFEELFNKYQVDIYMTGHVHAYERQYPVYNNTILSKDYINPSSPVYIVNGAAGNVEGHDKDFPSVAPSWNAVIQDQVYGYGIMEIYNSTTLHWQWFASDTDELVDEIYIVKNH